MQTLNRSTPMAILDRVFLIVFARYRREKKGSNLESAWYAANYKVSMYVTWPIAAAAVVLIAIIYSLVSLGTQADHKKMAQIVAVIAWVVAAVSLDRRFRKYLYDPPPLIPEESISDRQLVFRFRSVLFGAFVLTCATGMLLHLAGVRLF